MEQSGNKSLYDDERSSNSIFSCTRVSSCKSVFMCCEPDEGWILILDLHFLTHFHFTLFSFIGEGVLPIRFWSRERQRIGANDMAVNSTSFNTISGFVTSDCTLRGVGEGVEATCWRISPICGDVRSFCNLEG